MDSANSICDSHADFVCPRHALKLNSARLRKKMIVSGFLKERVELRPAVVERVRLPNVYHGSSNEMAETRQVNGRGAEACKLGCRERQRQ